MSYWESKGKGKRYTQGRDQLHDAARKEAFGLTRKDKWPDEGIAPRWIQTNGMLVTVYVLSKEDARIQAIENGKNPRLGRRCWAVCPHCQMAYDAGHLGQHLQACEEL